LQVRGAVVVIVMVERSGGTVSVLTEPTATVDSPVTFLDRQCPEIERHRAKRNGAFALPCRLKATALIEPVVGQRAARRFEWVGLLWSRKPHHGIETAGGHGALVRLNATVVRRAGVATVDITETVTDPTR
jgi:hypothetical protein